MRNFCQVIFVSSAELSGMQGKTHFVRKLKIEHKHENLNILNINTIHLSHFVANSVPCLKIHCNSLIS